MSLLGDIALSYRSPSRVVQRRISGAREADGLAILLFACLIAFVAQIPQMAENAAAQSAPMIGVFAGTLVAVFLATPLFFYVVAIGIHLISSVIFKLKGGFRTRYAVFWTLAAVSPVVLLSAGLRTISGGHDLMWIVNVVVAGITLFFLIIHIRAVHTLRD